MQYVTVFEEVFNVKRYPSGETVKTFKCPEYPLNEFKLKCANYNTNVCIRLFISGPIISNLNLKIAKQNGKRELKKFDLSGGCYADFYFDNSQSLIEEPGKNYLYMCVVDLKIEFSVPPNSLVPSRKLALFNNPDFSDFKVCVDKKTFDVSKSTIAMSSKILESKIAEMTKKQEDKLILDDFNAQVVQKMLEFAYDKNVKLKNDMKFVEQLLIAAEKYEIGELKTRCEAILLGNINNSTACRYFGIAEKNECMELRKKCADYLRAKYTEFSQKKEFKDLLAIHPDLAVELCFSLINQKLNTQVTISNEAAFKILAIVFGLCIGFYVLNICLFLK